MAPRAEASGSSAEDFDSSKGMVQVSMKWSAEDLEAIDFSLTGTIPNLPIFQSQSPYTSVHIGESSRDVRCLVCGDGGRS